MEYLHHLLEKSDFTILSAFILGLMTAISPCPLTMNITATAYISREIDNRKKVFRNGLLYVAGMGISYILLGLILYFGAGIFHVKKFFLQNGEKFVAPALIFIGIVMLDIIRLKFPRNHRLFKKIAASIKNGKGLNSLLLGILFAIAFCPYGGFLFFGMLIPMTITSVWGLFLPAVFALGAGLPVVIISYLLAYNISEIGIFYNKLLLFEKWFRKFTALLFLTVGTYYVWILFIKK